jgi:hypothetical protein
MFQKRKDLERSLYGRNTNFPLVFILLLLLLAAGERHLKGPL